MEKFENISELEILRYASRALLDRCLNVKKIVNRDTSQSIPLAEHKARLDKQLNEIYARIIKLEKAE